MTRRARRLSFAALCASAAVLFAALGVWQLERRAWKHDLIARVEARVAAAPVAAPPRSAWASLDPHEAEYRRVTVRGRFDHARSTLVDALTERGPGYWLLTPLVAPEGTILVNRGLVPKNWRAATNDGAFATVTGFMRVTEPDGRILRPNRPSEDRWFSRDVAAIAAARGLGPVAPFFIDAEDDPADPWPVGGLTVIRFADNHLLYAITWFGLAALSMTGLALVLRSPHKTG